MSFKDFFINTPATTVLKDIVANQSAGNKPYYAPPSINGMSEEQTIAKIDSKSTDDFNQYLMKLMDDANLPGPDYYEFVKALKALEAIPLTEQQKYVSVFAGFQAQGVTAQSLIDAAQKYIAILGQKKSSEFDTSVASASAKLVEIDNMVKQLTEENEQLTAKLTENAKKIAGMSNQSIEMRQKLEIKKTTFEMSFKNFINKIMSDIDNITKYLIDGNATK